MLRLILNNGKTIELFIRYTDARTAEQIEQAFGRDTLYESIEVGEAAKAIEEHFELSEFTLPR